MRQICPALPVSDTWQATVPLTKHSSPCRETTTIITTHQLKPLRLVTQDQRTIVVPVGTTIPYDRGHLLQTSWRLSASQPVLEESTRRNRNHPRHPHRSVCVREAPRRVAGAHDHSTTATGPVPTIIPSCLHTTTCPALSTTLKPTPPFPGT
jgi:hypothetical protein